MNRDADSFLDIYHLDDYVFENIKIVDLKILQCLSYIDKDHIT